MTVYTTDLEGRLTSTNRSWSEYAAINGAPRLTEATRVCGQSLWSAIGDPAYTAQMHHALELLRSGASTKVSWEFPCSSPDEERVFLMNITALREEERVTGFVFSTVDISPSHRSREALIDTGLALSRTIDLDRVFYEVGHQLQRAVGAEHFAVLLNSDDGATLKRTYSVGYPDDGAALDQRLVPLAQHAMERTETVECF